MSRPTAALIVSLAVALSACHDAPTAPSCTYRASATQTEFAPEGGAATLDITAPARCSWTARADADWLTFGGPSSGIGNATLAFAVAANAAGVDRSTTIALADQQVSIRQSARACEFSVTPAADVYDAEGGRGTVTVDAAPGCQWTAVSAVEWLRISAGAAGTGPGVVEYVVSAHDGDDRDGTLMVAGHPVTIHQEGRVACSFTTAPDAQTFDAAGGSGAFDVQTAPACEWSVRSDAAWVRITMPGGGAATGGGRVVFTVDGHASAEQRTATITAGTARFTVVQRGSSALSEYSVEPITFRFHWHGTNGQRSEVRVSTASSCAWTAAIDVSWLSLLTAGGNGPGSVTFGVAAYTAETTRRAAIMLRWPTPTAGQNVWISQEGCRYGISTRERTFGPEGGRVSVTVFATAVSPDCPIGCPWTATTTAGWIHITTPMPSAGDNEFFFNVDANTSGADRSATIAVAGMTLVIIQRGG